MLVTLAVLVLLNVAQVRGLEHTADPKLHSPLHLKLVEVVEEVYPTHFQNKAQEIQVIKDNISKEIRELIAEEEKLSHLVALRNRHKKGFWFFDHDARRQVDNYQYKVNEQKRQMEQTLERVEEQWNNLKPLYGLYSKLFLSELFARLVWWLSSLADAFFTILAVETVFLLLVVGPLTIMFSVLWFSIGSMLLNILFKVGFSMFTISTLFELPGIMIRYHPTPLQFALVYAGLTLPLIFLTAIIWGWEYRKRSSSRPKRD